MKANEIKGHVPVWGIGTARFLACLKSRRLKMTERVIALLIAFELLWLAILASAGGPTI
jgi:hypothetical protein